MSCILSRIVIAIVVVIVVFECKGLENRMSDVEARIAAMEIYYRSID